MNRLSLHRADELIESEEFTISLEK